MKTCIPTINTYLYRFSVFASLLPIVLDACESIVSNPISHVWQIRSEQKINKYGKRLLHMQYSIVVFIHRTDAIRLQEKIYRHQTSQCDCLEYVHFSHWIFAINQRSFISILNSCRSSQSMSFNAYTMTHSSEADASILLWIMHNQWSEWKKKNK